MFVRQAHSFAQQARLAITLAWVAGCTNTVSILACGHVISHVSGTTSDFGRHLADRQWDAAGFLLYLLLTFTLGAALSGVATEIGRKRQWDSIYVLPMAIEMVLLGTFALGVSRLEDGTYPAGWMLYAMTGVASIAMGLQNATITRISSGVVRTTHVTGVLTDFGLELTALTTWIAQRKQVPQKSALPWWKEARAHPTGRRVALLGSIVGSFALGACLGALLRDFEWSRPWAMVPPVLFLAWIVYQDVSHPIAEIEPSELIGDTRLELPEGLLVYHLRRDTARSGPHHRMPNLLAWSERLPATAKVIILDIDEVKELDEDAAFELRALLTNLRRSDKHLVIAGVTPSQFKQLQAAGTADLLETNSVCADLELAIARGFNMLFGR